MSLRQSLRRVVRYVQRNDWEDMQESLRKKAQAAKNKYELKPRPDKKLWKRFFFPIYLGNSNIDDNALWILFAVGGVIGLSLKFWFLPVLTRLKAEKKAQEEDSKEGS